MSTDYGYPEICAYCDAKDIELQSLRDQLAAKNEELARYIAANSILCDSESEVELANENNRLEIENRKLKEALKS